MFTGLFLSGAVPFLMIDSDMSIPQILPDQQNNINGQRMIRLPDIVECSVPRQGTTVSTQCETQDNLPSGQRLRQVPQDTRLSSVVVDIPKVRDRIRNNLPAGHPALGTPRRDNQTIPTSNVRRLPRPRRETMPTSQRTDSELFHVPSLPVSESLQMPPVPVSGSFHMPPASVSERLLPGMPPRSGLTYRRSAPRSYSPELSMGFDCDNRHWGYLKKSARSHRYHANYWKNIGRSLKRMSDDFTIDHQYATQEGIAEEDEVVPRTSTLIGRYINTVIGFCVWTS